MVWKVQKTRDGRTISREVNPKIRVEVLEFIRRHLRKYSGHREFITSFTLNEYLTEKNRYMDEEEKTRERQRLRRLIKSGWMSSHKNENGELAFSGTKKFESYIGDWGSFDNPCAPLMRSKEKIVKKRIEKQTKETEKTTIKEDVVGFV